MPDIVEGSVVTDTAFPIITINEKVLPDAKQAPICDIGDTLRVDNFCGGVLNLSVVAAPMNHDGLALSVMVSNYVFEKGMYIREVLPGLIVGGLTVSQGTIDTVADPNTLLIQDNNRFRDKGILVNALSAILEIPVGSEMWGIRVTKQRITSAKPGVKIWIELKRIY